MARRKAAALDVPANEQEALALVADYVAADRRQLELALGFEIQIDRLKAERDAALGRIKADQASRFARVKAWWEAGGKALAGKRRSTKLAGATLGVRLTPPAVKFGKGWSDEAIIDWLGRVVGGKLFLRTKTELDKQAVIKALQTQEPMAGPLGERGVSIKQADEFFIDTQLDEAAIRTRFGMTAG